MLVSLPMKSSHRSLLLSTCLLVALSPQLLAQVRMPYAKAGLNRSEAAAHLLSRLSFGPTPGEVERVAQMGPEKWFESQLKPTPDPELDSRLSQLSTYSMSASDIGSTYMPNNVVARKAEQAGAIEMRDKEKLKNDPATRQKVADFARSQNYRPERELMAETVEQKLVHTVHAKNQLEEVLTDFWYNHFYVSMSKNQAKDFILSYERDAIRPYSLGTFRQLLGSSSSHPAMLYFLDNAQSTKNSEQGLQRSQNAKGKPKKKAKTGLNENYAREILELHTLGVDGGYQQKDVVEVARALTGWTAMPGRGRNDRLEKQLERARAQGNQIIEKGQFVFVAQRHDGGPKQILGVRFPGQSGLAGYQEGVKVLDLLSQHPSTARNIAKKFVIRFVSDEPDPKLVNQMSQVFLSSHGDTKAMLKALVESPEFWASRGKKVKSPVEYFASMTRALGGQIDLQALRRPRSGRLLDNWFEKMGQKPYGYQAPTGFPDRAQQWVNSGTIVNRINFAFAVCNGKVDGIAIPPDAANWKTLESCAQLFLAGHDIKPTVRQAESNANNPKFYDSLRKDQEVASHSKEIATGPRNAALILSSPEFQRR